MQELISALSNARIQVLERLLALKGKDSSLNERTSLEKLNADIREVMDCYKQGEWKARTVDKGDELKLNGTQSESDT